jgi:1,4-dihydroxy-2-naphthoate octaprenyltransferase
MKGKMKDCFKPHIYMHSLFGLGLGILVASLWSGVSKWWIGVIVMVVAVLLDMSRK